jgi:hypothetical protein
VIGRILRAPVAGRTWREFGTVLPTALLMRPSALDAAGVGT